MNMLRLAAAGLCLGTFPAFAETQTNEIRLNFESQPFTAMTVAHRAQAGIESRIFPENSIAAINLAINRGVGIIEIDPRLTSDGHYVLMHDATLDRTTNAQELFPELADKEGASAGQIRLSNLTLEQVKQLRLTDGFDGQTHLVPTLREAMETARGRVFLDLDLKEVDSDKLAELTDEYGTENLMAYNSDADLLKEVTDKTGIIPLPINETVLKGGDPIADFKRFQEMWGDDFQIMHTRMSDISPALVKLANEHGVRLWINTLNDADAAAERFDYSVWVSYLGSGANVYQSDMAIELTRFIALRDACLSSGALLSTSSCDVFTNE